jgi:hypothetical protein
MLNQTQQVQVQKIGTYQTLALTMGIAAPTRTIPPMNPDPNQYPYFFTFTLKNQNEVGTPFEINVTDPVGKTGINVTASQSGSKELRMASDYPFYPSYPIKPGGYVVVQAKFIEDPNNVNNLPACLPEEPYTYFKVNVTTDQNGGGSTKLGIIENDRTLDNQNFMYFFDPEVKTQSGPVDVYVYTVPFVLPASRITLTEPFLLFIPIENKGSGIIDSITIDLFYDQTILNIPSSSPFFSYCTSKICGVKFDKSGSPGHYTFKSINGTIGNGEIYTIYNSEGLLQVATPTIGKSTGLISVVAGYRYKQSFEEQISCIQGTQYQAQLFAICGVFDSNQTQCASEPKCKWCPVCQGGYYGSAAVNTWRTDKCVSYLDDCGYHCNENDAKTICRNTWGCDSDSDCTIPRTCSRSSCTCTM